LHHGHGTELRLAAVGRKTVGWRYRDLLAKAESGPGVGIQQWWEKMGSAGGDGLAVQSWGEEKSSGH